MMCLRVGSRPRKEADFSNCRDWRVVLIGTAAYERLQDLPAVRNNLTAVEDIFTDPDLGTIPPTQVTMPADPEHPSTDYEVVRGAAADAEDTLLVYFAGKFRQPPTPPCMAPLR
ncbi:hypothetical protein [Streptomyces sp. NPDC101776]|uniref:hypothetical protein n=1 Tax=Streptomyces sp. NPDC101776 TaxID=3366146 RepID=UPI00382AF0E0